MPDVSIIIPVYNIKTLLPRCVASLQAQTWQDFEVWLVDDGSTDGSGPLCDELAVKDARIHVLHKENGGQGLARDLGLDHAQGEYICYVDSDDEVLPNLLEDALRAAGRRTLTSSATATTSSPSTARGMPYSAVGRDCPH